MTNMYKYEILSLCGDKESDAELIKKK